MVTPHGDLCGRIKNGIMKKVLLPKSRLALLFILLSGISAFAQKGLITGSIMDEQKLSLPGANLNFLTLRPALTNWKLLTSGTRTFLRK
jgi:hypothetical protein